MCPLGRDGFCGQQALRGIRPSGNGGKTAGQIRELVAEQFTTVGSILESMAGELELYERIDTAAAGCVRDILQEAGLSPVEVSCRIDRFDHMTVEAEIVRGDRMRFHKGELTKRISRACGRTFAIPAVHPAGDTCRIVLTERPVYRARLGMAQHVCGNGRLCGDSWEAFQDGSGRQHLVISDGMGTGGRAAVDGTMATRYLRVLKAFGGRRRCGRVSQNSQCGAEWRIWR